MKTSGVVTILLQPGGEAGWCYYSEPVATESLPEEVWIELSQVLPDGAQIFGQAGPFADCEYTEEPVVAEIGALVSPDRTSFRIGVRLLEDTEASSVTIRWRITDAQAEPGFQLPKATPERIETPAPVAESKEEPAYDPAEFYIEAVPGHLYPGDKFMFICHRPEGMREPAEWSVIGEDAGQINSFGLYTAPDHVGVFQVEARVQDYRATAYVMVKQDTKY